jgi:signal transduction histidine kinase
MSGAGQQKHDRTEPLLLVVEGGDVKPQISEVLRENGFSVATTPDGLRAFEEIKTLSPDLILINAGLAPEAIETCRRFKENMAARQIPVILACDISERGCIAKAVEAGAADFVFKPFDAAGLSARVRLNLEVSKLRHDAQRSENRLRQLKAEKGEFLGIVAHDLRSPLSNIVTSAEIIGSDAEMPHEQVKEFADIICSSARHMIHLVENLMDLNAIEQGRMQMQIGPCELGELVRGVAANYDSKAKAKQQELKFEQGPGPLVAMADPHSAIQIFDNLLSNAIKYSPAGKRIDVRIVRRNGVIRCEVQDQGPGLNKDDLQKMFGQFAKLSARPTGGEPSTGLGLSIVKKMVEAAGGNVWCESEPGKGSTFVVELRSAAHA